MPKPNKSSKSSFKKKDKPVVGGFKPPKRKKVEGENSFQRHPAKKIQPEGMPAPTERKFDGPKPPERKFERPKPTERKFERQAPSERPERPARPKHDRLPPVKAEAAAAVEEPIEPFVEPPTFAELGLDESIVRAITELGFERPTPIQARAIPVLLEGGDLIGQAQTGTGKTAAFALPIIQKIDASRNETQALILAPTRELAIQVAGGIWDLCKHTGLKVVPVYGGQPIDRQFRSLRNGAQIVVGTPGRVLDHLRRGSLTLDKVAHCTLDEADEMMALGFTEDMEAILAQLPAERQVACFSATMPPKIVELTKKFLRNPRRVSIESKQRTLSTTNQTYYEVPRGQKLEALGRVLDMESPGPTIVFCRTRQETSDLSDNLRLRGYNTEALHGDMNQGERDRVMRRFRDGHADLLIATDVAARGLDIETVTHVINYDIPWDVEQYIHRIGRTGRAGRTGDAITLVEGRQRRQLEVIERVIGSKIKPARIPTAADIASRRRDEFKNAIRETLEAREFEGHLSAVEDLQDEFAPADIAAAALHMLWRSRHAEGPGAEEVDADFEQPESGMTRIFIGMGRQDGLRPGDIVGAIAGEAGLTGKAIGVIDILDFSSFVEVPAAEAEKVVDALRHCKLRNKKVKVQLARHGEEEEAPDRGDRQRNWRN